MKNLRAIENKNLKIEVTWHPCVDRHPLWDKLCEKLLTPLPKTPRQTCKNDSKSELQDEKIA